MVILITGAAGFIGTHLFHTLSRRSDVEKIFLLGHGVSQFSFLKKVVTIDGDISEVNLLHCEQPDVIYHLAGGSSVQFSLSNPIEDFDRTVRASRILMQVMTDKWINTRLIYLSSAAVYGESGKLSTSILEPCRPVSPYGMHKYLVEKMLMNLQAVVGSDVVIVRPFSVYGEGLKKQLLWDALNKANNNQFRFYGTGEELRDWVYIDDLIQFLMAYMDNINLPSLVNVGTGQAISVSHILNLLLKSAGYSNPPLFSKKTKEGDPSHLVCDMNEQKTVKLYLKTSLETGIAKYIDWFNKEVK